ncbi:phosphatidylinositol-glycan biosynthesis class f protein-related [Holotrichia oblita]|uniref:Phosphatidylinositol-glycan biosynthesis class f protein-related n=3 Tax=Holotrichia oblita TaxID=644536 RepID=A0ACB9T345_HOLOL|nr:phosphatidylinositol-glycan biosynthesis class f protein-related [Holotrichia oblita]KAI4461250.1 phosphatidylinositol-glycan biosynthesis class f protein-related [Holotrichia oblita]KAI4461254.1 phosphatidylinositol-glycan biosynthesis class f protein-related [Holotrichia oblita]
MNLLTGIDLHCPLLRAAIALLVIGFLTVISLLKFYAYITCGRCTSANKMKGKTVIVTGATGGIGKETAKDLAARGARVILACRNTDYGNQIKDEFVKETQNENIVVKKLDLSSQKSIREFAKDINQTEAKLDVLIHNAGTAELRSKTTEDGLELTMATNHFGPFLLTHLLIDLLKRSAPSRIVVVASGLYRLASVNLNKLNPVDSFCPAYIYYVSKYVNIYFTEELARRLEGTNVTANCLHPGMIDSGIWRNVPAPLSWPLKLIVKSFFKTPEQGCQTSVYVAVSDEIEGVTGKYFIDCKEGTLSNAARDMAKAKKVWELSEQLVNLQPDDPKI